MTRHSVMMSRRLPATFIVRYACQAFMIRRAVQFLLCILQLMHQSCISEMSHSRNNTVTCLIAIQGMLAFKNVEMLSFCAFAAALQVEGYPAVQSRHWHPAAACS